MPGGSHRAALRAEQVRAELRLVASGRRGRDRVRVARILLHAHARLGRAQSLLGWLNGGPDPPRQVELRSGVRVLARRADAVPLYEQFGLDVYGVTLPGPAPRAIVDVGANVGYAAITFARRYPAARLVCVEPEPASRELLRANLELNAIDAAVFDFAVVGLAGDYRMLDAPAPSGVAVAHRTRADAESGPRVEGITLGTLLDRAQIDHADLVKLDIEGSEWSVFADAASWAPRVGTLLCELHGDGGAARADGLLGPHAFNRVALPPGLRFRDVACYVRGATHRG